MRLGFRTAAVAAVAAAAGLSLAACGGSGSSSGGGAGNGAPAGSYATAPVATDMVSIKNFTFVPMAITVTAGTTVTWTNQDSATHTVTAEDKSFDSGNLAQGQTFRHTFDKPGTYSYICMIHQFMHGTVIVH